VNYLASCCVAGKNKLSKTVSQVSLLRITLHIFTMLKKILTLQTPFQNLKLITMIIKIFGLLSCKLVKGRLKPSASGRCYCALWILIHCAYTGLFYYDTYIASLEKDAEQKFIIFNTLRFTIFVASIIPYNYVACFQEQEFIKVNVNILHIHIYSRIYRVS